MEIYGISISLMPAAYKDHAVNGQLGKHKSCKIKDPHRKHLG